MIREAVRDLRPFAHGLGVELDPETVDRLAEYAEFLASWNRRVRLVGDRDVRTIIGKHVADSLAIVSELGHTTQLADIGSGAGFPGLVVACARPELRVVLIEPRLKASSFLRAAAAQVGIQNVSVVEDRVEHVAGASPWESSFGITVSRAVRLDSVVAAMARLLEPGGVLLAMVSGRQEIIGIERQGWGLQPAGSRSYRLPTGESRRIVRYVRA